MLSRRTVLKQSLLGLGLSTVASSQAWAANACVGITPAQVEGPFYPIAAKIEADNDLTQLEGHLQKANGEHLYIMGQVSDKDCKPIPGAIVEIWQACESGKYNHQADPNPATIDPHFQYFGRCVTDVKGIYIFKTIRPGQYPAGDGWIRPSHIHFKIQLRGYEELTTQMYFKDDPYNESDYILNSVPEAERQRLIVDFDKNQKDGLPLGEFNIVLNKIVARKS